MASTQIKALFQNAVADQVQGNLKSAYDQYIQVLKMDPRHIPSLNNLGAIYLHYGERAPAVQCFKEAVKLNPSNGDAWNNLGILFARSGDPAAAVDCYQKALQIKPDSETATNLGAAYKDLGDFESSEKMHQNALKLDPQNANAYNNLGLVFRETGRLEAAVACFKKGAALAPLDAEILFNLAESLLAAGELEAAVSLSGQALRAFPNDIRLIVGAARVFIECGDWKRADPLIRAALAHPFSIPDLKVLRHLMLFLNASACSTEDIARIHFLSGRLIQERARDLYGTRPFDFTERFAPEGRLRIGYVSPDFNRHSVGWFFKEILENHDRTQFEIYCYALSDKTDDLTQAIMAGADVFRQVAHMGERQLAEQIHKDRIQILVDLAGYTRANRLDLFALKPAPVQVTGVGYPHGSGLKAIDYRLTDRLAEGAEAASEYCEQSIFMERFFLPFSLFETGDEAVSKIDLGLEPHTPTLASFNAWHKLRPEVLRLWNRILARVPKGVLAFSFRYSDHPYAQDRVRRYFDTAPERILFLSQTAVEAEHRARYQAMDAALDPFPYCGTTTSWEALCMGVPVITLKGERHVQRTTYSLLVHLGLDFLVAESEAEYEDVAVALLTDPVRLHAVQRQVQDRVKAVRAEGNRGYVQELEAHFQRVWAAYRGIRGGGG